MFPKLENISPTLPWTLRQFKVWHTLPNIESAWFDEENFMQTWNWIIHRSWSNFQLQIALNAFAEKVENIPNFFYFFHSNMAGHNISILIAILKFW